MPHFSYEDRLSRAEFAHIGAVVRRAVRRGTDADDILQEVLLELVQRPPADRRELDAWIRVVALNFAAKRGRSERARRRRERAERMERHQPSPLELLEARGQRSALRQLIWRIGSPCAEVIELRFLYGLSHKDIGARTGRSASTVRKQLDRGLKRLRILFGVASDDPGVHRARRSERAKEEFHRKRLGKAP